MLESQSIERSLLRNNHMLGRKRESWIAYILFLLMFTSLNWPSCYSSVGNNELIIVRILRYFFCILSVVCKHLGFSEDERSRFYGLSLTCIGHESHHIQLATLSILVLNPELFFLMWYYGLDIWCPAEAHVWDDARIFRGEMIKLWSVVWWVD